MKKLGKKFSYFTKIFLVLGLIFSNLSSLSVVFAYEATEDFVVSMTEDDKILVNYLAEIEETDEVTAIISENYTYLDESSVTPVETSYTLTGLDLVNEDGVTFTSIVSSIIFDGLYEVSVSLYNETDDVEMGTVLYSENIAHESGIDAKVYDAMDNEILKSEDGKYHITTATSSIRIVSKILPGGMSPMDQFEYDEVEYFAKDLVEVEDEITDDFSGLLYGDYEVPLKLELLSGSEKEEVVLESSINIMYESYLKNAETFNGVVSTLPEYDGLYEFVSEEADGLLYILADKEETHSLLEIYNLVQNLGLGTDTSFVISNGTYQDVLASFEELKLSDETLVLEDFLDDILVDDETIISFTSRELTISYRCSLVGDFNDDQILSQEDLTMLIEQVVGKAEVNSEKANLYDDLEEEKAVNTLDVMYLHQVLKNAVWDISINKVQAVMDAKLQVMDEDIVSGDTFTVSYILSVSDLAVNGISGLINYDEEYLKLVDVQAMENWLGDNHNGKFLYLADESLLGTEITETPSEDETDAVSEEIVEYEAQEFTVLTLTFEALKAGSSVVEVVQNEYFDQDNYYVLDEMSVTTEVVVNESDDNTLKSLTVAGVAIELQEDVLSYTIEVANDVVSVPVEAITSNIAASISSIVSPEELVEGENTITIVVTAENGDELVYTVIVNREAAPEEEEVTHLNYQPNYDDNNDDTPSNLVDDKDEEEVVPSEEEEPEEESNLSRIVIIILILLVIAGLIYLIFKDDEEDNETRKANKEINKLKKEKDLSSNKEEKKVDKSKNRKKHK